MSKMTLQERFDKLTKLVQSLPKDGMFKISFGKFARISNLHITCNYPIHQKFSFFEQSFLKPIFIY